MKVVEFPEGYWRGAEDFVDRYLDGRVVTTPDGVRHRGRTDGVVEVRIDGRLAYRAYGPNYQKPEGNHCA